MTDEMMNRRALLETSPDADLLREMIGFASRRLMELEVGARTGAAYGEKNAERLAQRSSTICRRNSGVYMCCDFAIWDTSLCDDQVSTKAGQVQNVWICSSKRRHFQSVGGDNATLGGARFLVSGSVPLPLVVP